MTSHVAVIVAHFREALGQLEDYHDTGLLPSNRQKSTSRLGNGWFVAVPQSTNTPRSRDRDEILATHTVTVTLATVVKPTAQAESYDAALEGADLFVKTILDYTPMRADVRTSWVSTARQLSPTGDYIYSTITFRAMACASQYS